MWWTALFFRSRFGKRTGSVHSRALIYKTLLPTLHVDLHVLFLFPTSFDGPMVIGATISMDTGMCCDGIIVPLTPIPLFIYRLD